MDCDFKIGLTEALAVSKLILPKPNREQERCIFAYGGDHGAVYVVAVNGPAMLRVKCMDGSWIKEGVSKVSLYSGGDRTGFLFNMDFKGLKKDRTSLITGVLDKQKPVHITESGGYGKYKALTLFDAPYLDPEQFIKETEDAKQLDANYTVFSKHLSCFDEAIKILVSNPRRREINLQLRDIDDFGRLLVKFPHYKNAVGILNNRALK